MRPSLLAPFFQDISTISGIGPKITTSFTKLCGQRVLDVAFHLPKEVLVRHKVANLNTLSEGQNIIAPIHILYHTTPSRRGQPLRITASNNNRKITLVFFNGSSKYWIEQLPVGHSFLISGRTELFNDTLQIVHPDHIIPLKHHQSEDVFTDDDIQHANTIKTLEPLYPLSAGITHKTVQKTIAHVFQKLPILPEWLDATLLSQEKWSSWNTTLHRLHNPEKPLDLHVNSPYRRRLAFDELFASQLALQIIRHKRRKLQGQSIVGDFSLRQKVLDSLPYDLTNSQKTALSEIYDDMAKPDRMLRLLQGDVGSGKTIVALLAMVCAVESGGQACLLAPTEILTRQHYDTIAPLLAPLGIQVDILTSREKGKKRDTILKGIADGQTKVIIGTHAIFQDDVHYCDLKLAIIDEQHRFGVEQRLQLSRKGKALDMLVMTATPIPRSLMLSAYGDMDYSQLPDKPAGRQPIDTRLLSLERINELTTRLHNAMTTGAQIYWVCPLVEESEKLDYTAAEDRYAMLCGIFGESSVGLVHGRLKSAEKDHIMERFINGQIKILVATTVIEVGVNVPNATIMIIEQAEQFGLAQLHQLRGRVGRGDAKSTCILLYGNSLSETARQRLEVMRETEDGFIIAEKDLSLRGYGEVLGTKQSGTAHFTFVDLAEHHDLIHMANQNAKLILDKNPDLQGESGENLRILLYLFERDNAFYTLQSG